MTKRPDDRSLRVELDSLDSDSAPPVVHTFLELASIPSQARDEARVASWCQGYLEALGLQVDEDDAGERIPGGAGSGNIYVRLPATEGVEGIPIFFCAHLDTVTLDDDLDPVIEDRDGQLVITNSSSAILGGDNKAAVAVMLELVRELVSTGAAHAGVELILTPCEEIGLLGAKAFDVSRLSAQHGYVFDHANDIGSIVVQAPSQISIKAVFRGTASHSGIAPEDGRSSIRAAADAIAAMPHGRLDAKTTANVGLIEGGTAVNIVPEHCILRAEVRSLEHERAAAVTEEVLGAFTDAASRHAVDVDITCVDEYRAYCLREQSPVVTHAVRALIAAGYDKPELVTCGGGSDANVFNRVGKPCANLPNGMRQIHTSDEHIYIQDLVSMLEVSRQLVWCAVKRD